MPEKSALLSCFAYDIDVGENDENNESLWQLVFFFAIINVCSILFWMKIVNDYEHLNGL